MLDDARLLDADAELTVDICIVGSGAAGITIARELRDSGLSVLLLESGSFDADPAVQGLYAGKMTGIDTWELIQMRYRGCGGSTNLWNGFCTPLRPDDFKAKSYLAGDGWPIAYGELAAYYPRACQTVEIGTFDYDVATLSANSGFPLLPLDPSFVETRVYRYSPPTRFGTRYRSDLEASTNVRWMLNANLLAIRLTGPGGSISHLDCGTLDGLRFTVEASRYVLALGGIENARLLLVSNQEQPEGVANSSGLVGRFMEHPHSYQIATITFDGTPPNLGFYQRHTQLDADGVTNVDIQGALSIPAGARSNLEVPAFTGTIDSTDYAFGTDTPLTPIVMAPLLTAPPVGNPNVARLTLRMEQRALDISRISLIDDVDALGMRRIALDWQVGDQDRLDVRASFAYIGREIGRTGLGRVNLPPVSDELWLPNPGGHHLGTTRMSSDPKLGVVDGNLRAHDVPNLFIAGCSTFATGGDSNPTLSIVAFAHRLADYLKANSS